MEIITGLVSNYGEGGGGYKTGVGACEVLSLQKGEKEKVLAMLTGGGANKLLGLFLHRSFYAGDTKKFPLFKKGEGGGEKLYPVLKGRRKKFWTSDFLIL